MLYCLILGGCGDSTSNEEQPSVVTFYEGPWIQFDMQNGLVLAINNEETLWKIDDDPQETEQVLEQIGWSKISVGNHMLAIKYNGTLWAWGLNVFGEVGDGTTEYRSEPVQIGSDMNWVMVDTGDVHSLGLKMDGTIWAWGDNSYGQLGDGTTVNKSEPKQIGTDTDWAVISAGVYHNVALKQDGSLWSWGQNYYGELGNRSRIHRNKPVQIGPVSTWVSVSAGASSTFALNEDGTIWGWGHNWFGAVGIGPENGEVLFPRQIGTDTDWVKIVSDEGLTVALKEDGTLWAWGENSAGAIDETRDDKFYPEKINHNAGALVDIVAGKCTGALNAEGIIWIWGDLSYRPPYY